MKSKQPNKVPFVWELEKGSVKSYLVGTIHACDIDYSKPLEELVSRTKQIFLEHVPTLWTALVMAYYSTLEYACHPIGSAIDHLTDEEKTIIEKMRKMPLRKIKKESVISLAESSSELAGMKKEYGFESILIDISSNRDIPLHSLESTKHYLEAIKKIFEYPKNPEEIAKSLVRLIKRYSEFDPNHTQSYYELLLKYFNDCDEEKISKFIGPTNAIDKERDVIFAHGSIPALNKPSLVAVGLAHIVSDSLMLDIYRRNGIKVTRI